MLTPGTQVGGYRIEGLLGRGGMGAVYEATQLSLGRTVALKVLAHDLSENEAFRARFRREGRIQAGIDHDHIVSVYEAGEIDDGLFIAMRLIRGPNLKQVIDRTPLDPTRAVRILGPVADALDTAHEAGLVHRDVKPQNILVGRRDHGYLADFGLTRGAGDTALTQTGRFVGTLDYVAPEQLDGASPTGASDLYAFGAVVYECLTGQVPFPRPTEAGTMFAHLSEAPPRVTESRPDLPGDVDGVIARAMAKDPAQRYASADELMAALDRVLEATPTQADDAGAAPEDRPSPATDPAGTEIRSRAGVATRDDLLRPREPERPEPAAVVEAAPILDAEAQVAPPAEPATELETSGARQRPATRERGTTAADAAPAAPRTTAAPARRRDQGTRTDRPAATRARTRAAGAGRRRRLVVASGAVLLLAGAVVAGLALREDGGQAEAATLRTGAGTLDGPSGWTSQTPRGASLGLSGRSAVGAPTPGSRGTMVAGVAQGGGPSLLPRALTATLADPPGAADAVRLGRAQAYRYRGLRQRGSTQPLTVFAAPTTRGVLTILCSGTVGERAACERAAATVDVEPDQVVALGPHRAYADQLGAVLADLDRDRRAAARSLRAADTASAQASAARRLRDVHRRARAALEDVRPTPLERDAHRELERTLAALGSAYADLSSSARDRRRSAYARARDRIRVQEARLAEALTGLERSGYQVG